jgi:hypothetical protein
LNSFILKFLYRFPTPDRKVSEKSPSRRNNIKILVKRGWRKRGMAREVYSAIINSWSAKLVPCNGCILFLVHNEVIEIDIVMKPVTHCSCFFSVEAKLEMEQKTALVPMTQRVNVVEPLRQIAASPSGFSSNFAAQALKLMGEEVPYRLSQQVPLWSIQDVKQWVIQKGFDEDANAFECSRVDGDLLLLLTDGMLKNYIGMKNGILRAR